MSQVQVKGKRRTPSLEYRDDYIPLFNRYNHDLTFHLWRKLGAHISGTGYTNYGASRVNHLLLIEAKSLEDRNKAIQGLKEWGYHIYHVDEAPKVYDFSFGKPVYLIVARKDVPYVWLEDNYMNKTLNDVYEKYSKYK